MTAHVQELLKHRRWVEDLARRLVADPHQAEDLAQEALTQALHARPDPPPRSMRSWLATVLRNALTEGLRRDGGRNAREAFVARSASQSSIEASTLDLVERMSVHRSVVETVLELPEHYREVLLRRYFEDESPTRIAERLDVPVATVKTRLQRALARMREELDRAHGGDGRRWLAALAPLAARPPVAPLSFAALPLVALALVVIVATGMLWLRSGHSPRVAEVATRTAAGDAAPRAPRTGTTADPSRPPQRTSDPALASTNATLVRDLDALVGERSKPLAGRALFCDGSPAAGALLRFEPIRDPATGRSGAGEQIARSDPDGRFRFARPGGRGRVLAASPGLVTVYAGVHGTLPSQGTADDAHDVDGTCVLVARRTRCEGRVRDAAGTDLEEARVELRLPLELERTLEARGISVTHSDPLYLRTRTDAAGTFVFEDLPDLPGLRLTVRAEGYRPWSDDLPPSPCVLTLEPNLTLPAGRAPVSGTLTGSVRTAEGGPAAGARVSDGKRIVRTDAEGRFVLALPSSSDAPKVRTETGTGSPLEPIEASELRLWAVLEGAQPGTWRGDPHGPAPELRLGPAPLRLTGRVVDPEGRALRDVRVWLDDAQFLPAPERPRASAGGTLPGDGSSAEDDESLLEIRSGRRGQAYSFEPPETLEGYLAGGDAPAPRARTDTAGRFSLEGLADRPYRLIAMDPRTLRAASLEVRPGEAVDLVLDPAAPAQEPGYLDCRVVDDDGSPLAGVRVMLRREDFRVRREHRTAYSTLVDGAKTVSDAAGRFRLDDLPPELRLGPERGNVLSTWLRLDGPGILPGTWSLAEIPRTEETVELRVERRVSVRIRLAAPESADGFELHDASGTALPLLHARGSEREIVRRARLIEGESGRWSTSQRAATLVLYRDGSVTRREPVTLRASFENLLDL